MSEPLMVAADKPFAAKLWDRSSMWSGVRSRRRTPPMAGST